MGPKSTFIEERERAAQDGTELKVGAILKFLFKPTESQRDQYQLVGEVQRNAKFDTNSCASRAPLEVIEEDLTHAYRNNLLTQDTKDFLEPCIQYKNNLPFVVLADAYTAIKSKTTREGNSLKEPCHALHAWGFVPGKWLPLEDWMQWEDYYDPDRITPEMEDYAEESVARLPIKYQQVPNTQFSSRLTATSLSVAGHGWPAPKNGIYPANDGPFNHAFKLFKNKYRAKDSYLDTDGDWVKELDPNYKFFDWGYEIGIVAENPYSPKTTLQNILALVPALEAALKWLTEQIAKRDAPPVPPKPAPTNNLLNTMCLAIQKHEGWYPGSRSYRNKNPGNLVYAEQPGATKEPNGRFAVFATYEAGFDALKRMILNAATGKSKVYKPTMNLEQFFSVYAPTADNNNPLHYAKVVALQMNVDPKTFKLSQLLA